LILENHDPLVSYFVLAYNASAWIAATLLSIYDQGLDNIEVIIVDDASTDATPDVIQPFLEDIRIRYFRCKTNQGVGWTLPFALRNCRGTFLCSVDGDDALESSHTKNALRLFAKYPEAGVFSSRLKAVDENGDCRLDTPCAGLLANFPEYITGNDAITASLQHNIVPGPGAISRGAITRQILPFFGGGWRYSNDWILWMLHFSVGYGFITNNDKTVRYRVHSTSLSRRLDFIAIRSVEIRLNPLAGLRYSLPFSRDAAILWQKYACTLYYLWLLRAFKWYITGKLPQEYILLARTLYYSAPVRYSFLTEVFLNAPNIVFSYVSERQAMKSQEFPCSGLCQVNHPSFAEMPIP